MVSLLAVDHLGIRITERAASMEFYGKLGFALVAAFEPAKVMILRHPSGIEINLIENALSYQDGKNVLMDIDEKYPGYTHVALSVPDVDAALRQVTALGLHVSEGPVRLGGGTSIFLRDPDRNVIELRQSQG